MFCTGLYVLDLMQYGVEWGTSGNLIYSCYKTINIYMSPEIEIPELSRRPSILVILIGVYSLYSLIGNWGVNFVRMQEAFCPLLGVNSLTE